MGEVHTEEPKADILVLIEGRARYLAHLGHVRTPEILRRCVAEITRLRAALADAQAVGFAAGVEAAAKVAAMQAVYTREAIKRATASELVSNLVTVTKSRTAHDIEIAIRALTPPDLTAAAARVLLADDAAAHALCAAFVNGLRERSIDTPPYDGWSQKDKDETAGFMQKGLRAIAGDTP